MSGINQRELFIRLPFPQSVNTVIGKKYKSKAWRELFKLASQIAYTLSDDQPYMGSIHVAYYFQKDDFRVYDISNFVKLTDDAFTYGGLWGDDYQIDRCTMDRGRVGDPGEDWVFIHVKEVAEMPFLDADRLSRSAEEIKERTYKSKVFRAAYPKRAKRRRAKKAVKTDKRTGQKN